MQNFSLRKNCNHKSNAGFTLTEIAIVLGVLSAIIAGIWTAANYVNEKTRVTKAIETIRTLSSNMTNRLQGGYGTAAQPCGVAAPPACDVSANMITAQTIPAWATTTGNTRANHPWANNALAIWWMNDTTGTYRISLYGVGTHQGCQEILLALTSCNAGRPGCPVSVYTNGGATTFNTATTPFATTDADTLCDGNDYSGAGGANSVELDYTQ